MLLAAAMLALIDAKCVAAARDMSGSQPASALAFFAAMTISIASRTVSVSQQIGLYQCEDKAFAEP